MMHALPTSMFFLRSSRQNLCANWLGVALGLGLGLGLGLELGSHHEQELGALVLVAEGGGPV